jgi:hypothetical protein
MNDFFSRLEGHLDDAAKREASGAPRPRRAAIARPLRAVAFAAALLAIVAVGVTALPRIAADDTEQAADTGQKDSGWTSYVPLDCGEHSTAVPVEGGPFPEVVRERFAAFRSKAEPVRPAAEGFAGLPIVGLQTKEGRLVTERGDVEVYLIAVSHIDEDAECVENSAQRDAETAARDALPAKRNPGVCMLLQGPRSHAAGCWTLEQIDKGESVLGPKPFDLLAAVVPDGHPTVLVGDDGSRTPRAGGATAVQENAGVVGSPGTPHGPVRWRDAPQDAGGPHDYGCDGPVHPQTLAAYSVLENAPDDQEFEAPEGITFLSGPVLARETAYAKFWLIPAADQGDCSQPMICIATDFGSTAPQCNLVEEGSALLSTRVEPGGDPSLVMFGAAADGMPDKREEREGIEPVDLSAENNVLVGALTLSEEESRKAAEAFGATEVSKGGDGLTADHDDR